MKKALLGLLVIVSVFFLVGCEKKEAKPSLVGSWQHKSGYTYTFKEDGTGNYAFSNTKMEFTYKDKGEEVEILYKGNTMANTFKYRIEGKKLIIKDSFDNDVEYTKK